MEDSAPGRLTPELRMKSGASYGNVEAVNRETVVLLAAMLVLLVSVKSTKDRHSTSSLIRLECPVADT